MPESASFPFTPGIHTGSLLTSIHIPFTSIFISCCAFVCVTCFCSHLFSYSQESQRVREYHYAQQGVRVNPSQESASTSSSIHTSNSHLFSYSQESQRAGIREHPIHTWYLHRFSSNYSPYIASTYVFIF